MERLSDDEIEANLEGLEWERRGDAIERELERESFAEAIAFVNAVADLAERHDHHPDVLVHSYRKVRLTVTTHSVGGLTARDFALAAAIDGLG
jgi:4a-hydroxytetrahydrobiopterin dehydratase